MSETAADSGFPPWLEDPWRRLVERARAGRLPSGLLVTGASGVGKAALTDRLLQALLCQRASGTEPPCGECNACRSLGGGVHPEVLLLQPEEPGKEIVVDAVREANEFLSLSGSGDLRALVIRPADALNINAANALLKTLEEPPAGAVLILESSRPARLPATIRSRCQIVDIPNPPAPALQAWLGVFAPDASAVAEATAASLGRPLTAREILTDPEHMEAWQRDREILSGLLDAQAVLPAAVAMQRSLPETLLPRLQALLVSAQRLALTGETDAFGSQFPADRMARFVRRHGPRGLARLAARAIGWQRQAGTPLNPQLRMEDIALAFIGARSG